MQILTFAPTPLNFEALDEQLRAELGASFIGVSTHSASLRVFLQDGLPEALRQRAEKIVREHNATQLSASQQKEAQQQANLLQLRQRTAQPLDPKTLPTLDPVLMVLLERVQWLEAEVRAWRRE